MSQFNKWWSRNTKIKNFDVSTPKLVKTLCSNVWSESSEPYKESISTLEKIIEEKCKENRFLKNMLNKLNYRDSNIDISLLTACINKDCYAYSPYATCECIVCISKKENKNG